MCRATKIIRLGCGLLSLLLVAGGLNPQAYGAAMEEIGNKPLNERNYEDWKGIMPVINHKSRVYQIWVNGDEYFYYRGDTKALNDALRKFAKIDARDREIICVPEVVIRPGPGETMTFRKVQVPYDWHLHIQGGISKHFAHFAVEENDTNIWDQYPTLTIFVNGGNIALDKIKIPETVIVLEVADLRMRYLDGLKSDDHEVRGYAAYFLARVDFYNKENIAPITKLLTDENDWVRLMAAGALGNFGKSAASALPVLRQGLQDENERIRERFQQTIDRIEGAEDTTVKAKKWRDTLKKISDFKKSLSKASEKRVTPATQSR